MRLAAVGALVLALAALAVVARGERGPGTYELTAAFADVRGIVPGAEVRAGGLRVGTVREVGLGADARPVLRLAVERDYVVRTSGTAAVRLQSLSGQTNRYVGLTQGRGAPLRDGGAIARARTRSPTEVDDALGTLTPRVRADLRAALGGLDRATAGRGADVSRTLQRSAAALGGASAVLEDATADGAALRGLVADAGRISGALAGRPAALRAAARSTAALLRTTGARQRELAATLDGLPAALRAPRLALAEADGVVAPARALVLAARPGVRQLRAASGELRGAVQAASPALHEARGLTRTAPGDLLALTPLLREARPVLGRLSSTLDRANPILDQTRVRLPDFFSFFANWADFTTAYDANGHGARVGIVLPPTSTQRLAPDGRGAGQLAPPYLRTPGALEGEPWRNYADSFVGGGAKAADGR